MAIGSRASVGFWAGVGLLSTVGSAACASAEEAEVAAAASSAAFDDAIRADLRTALRIVSACGRRGGGALDAACVERASREQRVFPVDAAADAVTHDSICRALREGQAGNVYYLHGAVVMAGETGEELVAVERVWDLSRGQAAAFATRQGAIAAALGGRAAEEDGAKSEADAYAGFASSGGERNVVDAWAGRRFEIGGDHKSALATGATSTVAVRDRGGDLKVQVGAMPSGQSVSVFALETAAPALQTSLPDEGSTALDALTRSMTAFAASEAVVGPAGRSYVQLRATDSLSAGTAIAVHLLQLSGGQAGSFPAAVAAVVLQAAKRTEVSGLCAGFAGGLGSIADGLRRQNLVETSISLLERDVDPFAFPLLDPVPPNAGRLESEIVLAAFIGCQSLGWSDWTTGCFTGDNRGFDYQAAMTRSRLAGKAYLRGNGAPSVEGYVGDTHGLRCADTEGSQTCTTIKEGAGITATRRAAASSVNVSAVGLSANQDKVRFVFNGKNPLVTLAPAINGTIDVFVNYDASAGERTGVTSYAISGTHDGFPAWELYINGDRKHAYDPIPKGCTPLSLAGGCQQRVSGTWGP